MAYGSLNAGAISPGSGNTLTISEACTLSGTNNLGTNPTVTLGTLATISSGSLNASNISHTMFFNYTHSSQISAGNFSFDIFKGHPGAFHASLQWHIAAAVTGLNFSTGVTGFVHNGSALYQYGLLENHGAHLSAPTFAFSGSGTSAKCTVTFTSAVTLGAGTLQYGATVVSNVKLLAPA